MSFTNCLWRLCRGGGHHWRFRTVAWLSLKKLHIPVHDFSDRMTRFKVHFATNFLMYLIYKVCENMFFSFLIPSLPYCTVPVKQHRCSVEFVSGVAACILLISTLGKNERFLQRCYCASPSWFSEKSLFIAEARSPEFEASITVSFVLLSTLIFTDPLTVNSVESFEEKK